MKGWIKKQSFGKPVFILEDIYKQIVLYEKKEMYD